MSRNEVFDTVQKLLSKTLHVKDLEQYNVNVLRAIGKTIALSWRHKQSDKESIEARYMIDVLLQIRKLVHSKLNQGV